MFDSTSTWAEEFIQRQSKWQWGGTASDGSSRLGTRLHTDFELLYNVTVDSASQATCTLGSAGTCGTADTFATAQAYANVSFLLLKELCSLYNIYLFLTIGQ